MPLKKTAGRLLNKSCHRVHNQKAKYFLFAETVAPVFRHSEPAANGND
jgi:hypothetical protein